MKNESAFPTNNWQKMVPQSSGYSEGMTLRDYFAAKAMQGFAADPEANWQDGSGLPGMARCAYQWADAMLKAREK